MNTIMCLINIKERVLINSTCRVICPQVKDLSGVICPQVKDLRIEFNLCLKFINASSTMK